LPLITKLVIRILRLQSLKGMNRSEVNSQLNIDPQCTIKLEDFVGN